MKKKFIILSLLILLMSGCTVNYTIEINDDIIYEYFEANETNMSKAKTGYINFRDVVNDYSGKKQLLTSYDQCTSDDPCEGTGCSYYTKEIIDNNDELALIFSTTFNLNEYYDSSIANEYAPSFTVEKKDNLVKISAGGNLNFTEMYDALDKVIITVKTDYVVTFTNAKKNSDGDYYWSFPEDSSLQSLYITVDTERVDESKETQKKQNEKEKKKDEEKDEDDSKMLLTILLIISLVVLIGIFVGYSLSLKRKNNNRL